MALWAKRTGHLLLARCIPIVRLTPQPSNCAATNSLQLLCARALCQVGRISLQCAFKNLANIISYGRIGEICLSRPTASSPAQAPLRWTGILFAFAATLLLVTLADYAIGESGSTAITTVFAPLIAGGATALYTRTRGGPHALIGAAIALPLLVFVVFPTQWPLALFASLFCVLGASLTELGLRGPKRAR